MKFLAYFKNVKLAVLHPFNTMPVPDFNNKYDGTML